MFTNVRQRFALRGKAWFPKLLLAGWLLCLAEQGLRGDEKNGRLDLYFIDVEGGAATLLVTPQGESVLIDSGFPDNSGRDRDRILKVLRKLGRNSLDHAIISHFHLDHYGNHAALASQIKIRNFWDRGIPDRLAEDPKFPERISQYRAAAGNASRTLTAGDKLPLNSGKTPLRVRIVSASGAVIPNAGAKNPHATEHRPQPVDTSDNAQSISQLWEFGPFRFLTCGDLTWNIEAQLAVPKNVLGRIDLFMVTHHGTESSNNPALVLAIDPTVTVMCNGPAKGGSRSSLETVRRIKSLRGAYQLHRNLSLPQEIQAPAAHIANPGDSPTCEGIPILASVAPDGRSFTVQVGWDGPLQKYATRGQE